MDIYYASMTGNVRKLVSRLPFDSFDIATHPKADSEFVLITYTFGMGNIPEPVQDWLKDNHELMRGVVASGNKNWGNFYARAGDLISNQYCVPLLRKIELFGDQSDYDEITRRINEL